VRLRAPLGAAEGYPEAAMLKGSRFAALAAGVAVALAAPAGAAAARPTGGCMRLTFYAPTDWIRLATTLAANPAPCAQYYISIPPLAADKTTFRPDQPWRIRALGPNFHAVAEISYHGWSDWVAANNTTWYAAGVEARRRMAAQGFDVTAGDSWAVNESSSAVRTGSGAARQNLRDLVRGLYDAGGNGPPVKGIVFVVGAVQSSTNLSTYKGTLQRWFADAPFWTDMTNYVSDWSQETFGDIRNYAVPGASLTTRRDELNAWLQHPETLAAAGPPEIATAESFLQAAYSPLANAAWRYPAGSGFGMTDVPTAQMQDYVSAQVYAARSAGDNFGFAWSPKQPDGVSTTDFAGDSGALMTRLAAAIHDAATIPGAACAGTCTTSIGGASFNEGWKIFGSWSTEALVFANPSASTVVGSAVPLTVRLQLAGVIRPDTQPVTVTFTTTSSRGGFSTGATGPWTKTLAVPIPVGGTDAFVYYRDTKAGTPTISAAAQGRAGVQTLVRVQPGSVARLAVKPSAAALGAGQRRRFTATAVDAFGNSVAVVPQWSASGGKVSAASGASTVFTATRPGKARITATAGTARGSAVVNVAATVRVTRVAYAVAGGRLNVSLLVVDWRRHRVGHASVRLALRRNGRWLSTVTLRTDARGLASFARSARRGCYSVWIARLFKRGYAWNRVTPKNGSCVP
jgi:hypothetical protein